MSKNNEITINQSIAMSHLGYQYNLARDFVRNGVPAEKLRPKDRAILASLTKKGLVRVTKVKGHLGPLPGPQRRFKLTKKGQEGWKLTVKHKKADKRK